MVVKYAEITENLSASRLRTYRTALTHQVSGLTTADTVKSYFLLNDISQHFFVPLQLVEVVLRNRINDHIINFKRKSHWYDSVPATVKAKDAVTKAKDLAQAEVKTPTADDVVCRLTFGFWANLLDKPHRDTTSADHFLWDQHSFKKVFPGAERSVSIGVACVRLIALNTLRNRLFHHEPIWKSKQVTSLESAIKTVEAQYEDLLEVLRWLSPEKHALLKAWSFSGRMAMACDATRFDRDLW
jgi:hypothetical protein